MSKSDPEDDPRYIALLQLLRSAEEIWKASRVFFERWKLSPSQFNVLNLLRLHPEGLSQTELSKFLLMHRSNITGLIDQLETRGLARRRDAAGDRRTYSVQLAPAGSRLLAEILPSYYEGALHVWGGFSDRQAVQLTRILAGLAENVGRAATAQARREASSERRPKPRQRRP